MPDSVHDRLRESIEATGLNLKEFAEKCGVPYRTLQDYVAGKRDPGAENLAKIATQLRVSLHWVLTGSYIEPEPASIREAAAEYWGEYCFVPQVRGEISAGVGMLPDNAIEVKVAFRREWIIRHGDPENMSIIRVRGDSMDPTLQSGDLVLIDHGRNYIEPQGGIYAVVVDQQIMIKRLQPILTSGMVRIISDNVRYETIEAKPEKLQVNGKVIWFGRELER